MKVERNGPCPCNSGKKYKNCHMNMTDKPLLDASIPLESAMNRKLNNNSIKQCIHPNQDECKDGFIRAHSIQNNRILKKLGRNGDVYMIRKVPDETNSNLVSRFKKMGRGVATTFNGFCKHHDKELFKPIEDEEYTGSTQQRFLFSYRAFSFEYHKKAEAAKLHKTIGNEKASLVTDDKYIELQRGYEVADADMHRTKSLYDAALLSENYDEIDTVELFLPTELPLSVCSGFYLEYDLHGKEINDLDNCNAEVALLTLTVFPSSGKSVILFSWLRKYSSVYSELKQQLLALDEAALKKILNNLLPSYCENVVYNPEYIDSISKFEKQKYLRVFGIDSNHYLAKSIKKNLLKPTEYDLFK